MSQFRNSTIIMYNRLNALDVYSLQIWTKHLFDASFFSIMNITITHLQWCTSFRDLWTFLHFSKWYYSIFRRVTWITFSVRVSKYLSSNVYYRLKSDTLNGFTVNSIWSFCVKSKMSTAKVLLQINSIFLKSFIISRSWVIIGC